MWISHGWTVEISYNYYFTFSHNSKFNTSYMFLMCIFIFTVFTITTFTIFIVHILLYVAKVNSSHLAYNRCETWDKQP